MGAIRDARYLIDTSVIIARESGRPVGALPDDGPWCMSVVTVGELHRGVVAASTSGVRARRLRTYRRALRLFDAIEIDETVAVTWGEYAALARQEERSYLKPDLWIAATAATEGLILVTQDRGFSWFPDLDVVVV